MLNIAGFVDSGLKMMIDGQKTLVVVVGPTGIGKTALAIKLAQHYQTDIISADSRQFYKEMSIGTAVPSKEELLAVKHHFIQHKSIFDPYSVGDFEKEALALIDSLFNKKDILLMVGGSGLYIDAVIEGLDVFPAVDKAIRTQLTLELQDHGLSFLYQRLQELDPEYAKIVDPKNPHRVIRALEVCMASGKPYSTFLNKRKKPRNFKTILIGVEAPRTVVYERINTRVDHMMKEGLLEEVRSLKEHAHLNALQTVGYKELFKYLDGNCTLDEAIVEIKKNTRRFSKRQGTWFRKNSEILWIPYDLPFNSILKELTQRL
jgi:tRNA dimethylallyltransferase